MVEPGFAKKIQMQILLDKNLHSYQKFAVVAARQMHNVEV
jgi:hypothetical protein